MLGSRQNEVVMARMTALVNLEMFRKNPLKRIEGKYDFSTPTYAKIVVLYRDSRYEPGTSPVRLEGEGVNCVAKSNFRGKKNKKRHGLSTV